LPVLIAGSDGWWTISADIGRHLSVSPNIARCPPIPINAG
jgi:hypothetical protein